MKQAVQRIEEAGIERVPIRSALTCRSLRGICAMCYGRDLAQGQLAQIGEAIGIIAAQSIGEPGTQLTMRTFHIGGTASKSIERTSINNRYPGTVRFLNLNTVRNREGDLVAMNRNGEISIISESGRERERYIINYGAKLKVENGQQVETDTPPGRMGPIHHADSDRRLRLAQIRRYRRRPDHAGKSSTRSPASRARSWWNTGKPMSVPAFPSRTKREKRPGWVRVEASRAISCRSAPFSWCSEGDPIFPGDVLARIPRETTKTKDITGGLPRVAELFEVRKPKENAVITEIDGTVSFGKDTKGKRKVTVAPDVGDPRDYLIPKGKHISVHEGDYVRAGEPLMDGSPNPHDILDRSWRKGSSQIPGG